MQCRYTHVLKTDDDCYIRYPALEATLRQPPRDNTLSPKKPHMHMQMRAVYKGVCNPSYVHQSTGCIHLNTCEAVFNLPLQISHVIHLLDTTRPEMSLTSKLSCAKKD